MDTMVRACAYKVSAYELEAALLPSCEMVMQVDPSRIVSTDCDYVC